jgi:hypothetical protein
LSCHLHVGHSRLLSRLLDLGRYRLDASRR